MKQLVWHPEGANWHIVLGDGTPFKIGLHVRAEGDERHVGQIVRLSVTGTIKVRWRRWYGYYAPQELSAAPAEMIGFD
jgi:hypothetical protein